MIRFTTKCTGDLGISVNDLIVAMWFKKEYGFNVYDLMAGGEPYHCLTQDEALNRMLSLANRSAQTDEPRLAYTHDEAGSRL